MITITTDHAAELCAGFPPDHELAVRVTGGPPFQPTANTSVEYYWTADHANGSWSWLTHQPARRIPLPFPGSYHIQLKIMYIRKGRPDDQPKRPYAAFWSNKLQVTAKACE